MTSPTDADAGALSRRRGRPRAAEPMVRMMVSVSPALYDAIYAEARRRRITLPEVLRQAVRAHFAQSNIHESSSRRVG